MTSKKKAPKQKASKPQGTRTSHAKLRAKTPISRDEFSKKSPALEALPSSQILSVVAETDHYVIVDKPALFDSQNSREDRPSVVQWLIEKYGFSGLIHRLDYGTSGLLVCAKTANAAKELTQKLQQGKIHRIYWALVMGKNLPDSGIWTSALEGQEAETRFRVLNRYANSILVEVELGTGRKHQIRRHFSDAGFPLLGDHLYGKKGADRLFHRPALHARKLIVDGKTYTSEPPEDFKNLLQKMRPLTQ